MPQCGGIGEMIMAEKVYCIVKRGNNYYIPVKAALNPYNEAPAYLACLPNFFGGNIERGECYYLGLAREVKEESQRNVSIDAECLRASNVQLLYQCQSRGRGGIDYYRFYLVTMTEGGDYFAENCKVLDTNAQRYSDPAEREMSCILKIPVANDLRGKNVNEFLAYCWNSENDLVNFNPDNPDDRTNSALMQWKEHEGTKDAFKALFGLR